MLDAWWVSLHLGMSLLVELWYYQLMTSRNLVINVFASMELSTFSIIIEQLQQDCC